MIRATYQAFLSVTAKVGYLHSRQQTPAELQQALAKAFPEEATALNTITSKYEYARYASEPPTPDDASQVRRAWQQLGAILHTPPNDQSHPGNHQAER